LTALENVRLVAADSRNGTTSRDRAREVLETLGMGHRLNYLPRQLSDGEKQRVAIARVLAKDPALILADEPTANLDSRTGAALIDMMKEMNERHGITFVFSTHDRMVVERATRVVNLKDGRIAS
ncbi:MAG: ATP-binding cassette domain-containing protein, partial [Deltaproteobacteria bacterium]|nr:ATP-binding cassette domain-containing protein [Deltaproteobacteria bacterium]